MQLIDVKAGRILPTTSVVNIYKSVILCVLGYLSHLCGVPIFSWLKVANHPNGRSPPFFLTPRGGHGARARPEGPSPPAMAPPRGQKKGGPLAS